MVVLLKLTFGTNWLFLGVSLLCNAGAFYVLYRNSLCKYCINALLLKYRAFILTNEQELPFAAPFKKTVTY